MKALASGSDSNYDEFDSLLDIYAGYVRSTGRRVFRSKPEESRRIFDSLTLQRRLLMTHRLKLDVAVLAEASAAKEDLSDSKRMLWRFLQKVKYTPCSDIFDRIRVGDVVELYNPDQTHLWQNLAFFDWCSITLEQAYSDTWYESSKRDMEIHKKLADLALRVFNGEVRVTTPTGIPWHLCEETSSELLLKFDIEVKVMSPVFQDGQTVGLITVNQCRAAT